MNVRLAAEDLNVTEDYVGDGYGILTRGCLEAITLLARTEGILLDPSYSGKSMAGMIDHIRQQRWHAGQEIVFLHTGGTPALFAYNEQLADLIDRPSY
jgi:L-cysteate sulfo-lyase